MSPESAITDQSAGNAERLPEPLTAEIEKAAATIACRLADEELVAEASRRSAERARFPYQWGGVPLYAGHTGQSLVFHHAASALSDEGGQWHAMSRAYLRKAVAPTRRTPLASSGVGYGTAGLALAVAECTTDQPSYRPLLRRLNTSLAEQVSRRPDPRRPGGVNPGAFDVIQGAAGILGYLITVPQPEPAVLAAINRLIDDLVWLCTPDDAGRRWHVAPRFFSLPEDHEKYPHGYLDLGLAHGLPGPLAALSMAWTAGHRRPGMTEAVRTAADDLLELSVSDEWGRNWPRLLPLDATGRPGRPPSPIGRTAWCYGAPGVCSALLDAADALDDAVLRETAVDGFRTELRRLRDGHSFIDAATLCHGLSGAMLIAQKFADVTGDDSVLELTERVLSYCDPELPLVVQEVHVHAPDVRLDSPGLLDGAAGVALALWSVSRPGLTGWQRALMIR